MSDSSKNTQPVERASVVNDIQPAKKPRLLQYVCSTQNEQQPPPITTTHNLKSFNSSNMGALGLCRNSGPLNKGSFLDLLSSFKKFFVWLPPPHLWKEFSL